MPLDPEYTGSVTPDESPAQSMKRIESEIRSPQRPQMAQTFTPLAGAQRGPSGYSANIGAGVGPLSAMGLVSADKETGAPGVAGGRIGMNVGPVNLGYLHMQPSAPVKPVQGVQLNVPFDADAYFGVQALKTPGGNQYGINVGKGDLNAYGSYNPSRKDVSAGFEFRRNFAEGGPVYDANGNLMMPGENEGVESPAYNAAANAIGNAGAAVGRPLVNILRGAADIPSTVSDYIAEKAAGPDPSQAIGEDIRKLGGQMVEGIKHDPVGAALDVLPIVGEIRSGMDATAMADKADEAEAAGDFDKAKALRQLAAVAAAGAAPIVGTAGRLAKRGAKAAEEGVLKEAGRVAEEGISAEAKAATQVGEEATKELAPLPVQEAFNNTPTPEALRTEMIGEIDRSIAASDGAVAKLPTTMGLGPMYVVDSGVTGLKKKDGFLLNETKNANAERQLDGITPLLEKHPDMALNPDAWARAMAEATGSQNVVAPPYRFAKAMQNGEYEALLKTLTEGQIKDADAGFANGKEFLKAYNTGAMQVEDTGKLFMWGMLSRGVDPFTHEGLFLDAFNGIEPWVKMAAEGKFTKEIAEGPYKEWAATTSPKGSGQAGSGAMHNLNAFGRDFLVKMGTPNAEGVTPLQKLHDLMSNPDLSGRDIRREFSKTGEGVGIDNKVVSFIMLATGRDDVMVIDRIQLKNLWDDGRFGDVNIWDGISVPVVKTKDGVKRFSPTEEGRAAAKDYAAKKGGKVEGAAVTGSSLAEATYGAKGILIYEALEDALMKNVGGLYENLGRPQAASPGRFHWETWVARSNQEASHGTLGSILEKRKGSNDPLADVYSKQGDYQTYAYGSKYGVSREGPYYMYPLSDGSEVRLLPQQLASVLENVKNPKYGVVPKGFKVSETTGRPWYEREGVNRTKLDELIRNAAAGGQTGAVRKASGGSVSDGAGKPRGTGASAKTDAGISKLVKALRELRVVAEGHRIEKPKLAYLIRQMGVKNEAAAAYAQNILHENINNLSHRLRNNPQAIEKIKRLTADMKKMK